MSTDRWARRGRGCGISFDRYSDVIEPMMRYGATTSKARLAQEIATALFDPVSITREIEATPFPFARNVIIAYPHREDWKKL